MEAVERGQLRWDEPITASAAADRLGSTQVVMAPEKATSMITRAVMAGLAKL